MLSMLSKITHYTEQKSMIIERSQKKLLTKRIESEPRQFIQVLYGPRQVGKTTLALQFMESTNCLLYTSPSPRDS